MIKKSSTLGRDNYGVNSTVPLCCETVARKARILIIAKKMLGLWGKNLHKKLLECETLRCSDGDQKSLEKGLERLLREEY